jgi:hypothetical protein
VWAKIGERRILDESGSIDQVETARCGSMAGA